MASDLKDVLLVLFPYLVILYLVDCISYIKAHHLLFVSSFGRRFKLKKSGLCLIGLSPFDRVFISHNIPVCYTKCGIYILNQEDAHESPLYERGDWSYLPYENIEAIESYGAVVKINGKDTTKAPSTGHAKNITALIRELRDLPSSERLERIQTFLEETTDLEKTKAIRARSCDRFLHLRISTVFLFFFSFILLPLNLYLQLDPYMDFSILVYSMVLNYVTIITIAYFLHREMHKGEMGHRINTILPMILTPPTALHAVNSLTKDIYHEFDYLAVAAELLPLEILKVLIREEIERIRYSKTWSESSHFKEFWELRENSLHRLLANMGVSSQEVLSVPKKLDQSAASYCPVCGTEYRSGFNTCSDCGMSLKRFESQKEIICA